MYHTNMYGQISLKNLYSQLMSYYGRKLIDVGIIKLRSWIAYAKMKSSMIDNSLIT
jgi:hypothetical protein